MLLCSYTKNTVITKTCLYNFEALKPYFYIVKQGFTEYTLFFLFLLKNIECGYSLEPPRRGGSNEYLQSMFLIRSMKNISYLSENSQFLEVIYLNRLVFVMDTMETQKTLRYSAVNSLKSYVILTSALCPIIL